MGLYTIKNSDYNQEIRANEEVIVGMTLVSEEIDTDNLISKWYLNTKEEQLDNSKFDVSYTEYSAWDSEFNGAITITNKTNETIKNWTLGFRRSSTINVVNQAVLEDSSENNYVITNDGFNTNILGNSSISFGI